MKPLTPLLALALLAGCASRDADGDGRSASIDCDDSDPLVFPGAIEHCDGIDNDCSGVADDSYAAEAVVFFLDEDGDGYGTTAASQLSCANVVPAGFVADASDCDDADRDVNPGAEERCNLVDDNCNDMVDDNPSDAPTWYADNDEDGFGSRTLARRACEGPPGWIKNGGDCNDFDFLVNPNALEYCDGFDNDCDDITDEPDSEDHKVWYLDSDEDGHGDAKYSVDACYQPDGYSPFDDDCNDVPEEDGALQTPGVEEICQDGIDNNCNDSPDQCSYLGWSASTANLTTEGSGGGGYLGYAVDIIGDADGDGVDDIVWGEYYGIVDTYSGDGVLQYGELDGVHTETELLAEDMPRWGSSTSYDYMGRMVNHLGDIDRDGYDDFGIGSYTYDGGASNGGAVFIIYGDSTRHAGEGVNAETEELPSLVGWSSSTYAGSSMGPAGDFTGDGYTDMLISGYYYNHDGMTGAGAVWLVPGAASRYDFHQSLEPFAKWVGPETYTYLGYLGPVLDSGDLDADGYSDITIGSYGYSSYSGASFVIYGSGVGPSGTQVITDAADTELTGASTSNYFGGYSNQIPGDLNDDGYDDLVVGQYQANSYAGACYIFFGGSKEIGGGSGPDRADVTINGSGSSTYLCYGRPAVGDFDNDGVPELVVGAYRQSSGSGSYNGASYVFTAGPDFGTDDELDYGDAVHTINGPNGTYAYFGYHQAAGDVNGDGYDDLVVGAYGDSGYDGVGYVFFGNSI